MLPAITLFLLYAASAWVMLRSVTHARLEPIVWGLTLAAIFAHSDAIVHLMHSVVPFSIGLLEATSMLAWTLAVLACFIAIERQNRALAAILLGSAALGATATGSGRNFAEDAAPGWELTAHILLSMGAAALLFAAAVTAVLLVVLGTAPARPPARRPAERVCRRSRPSRRSCSDRSARGSRCSRSPCSPASSS